jgi:hypothetical protein
LWLSLRANSESERQRAAARALQFISAQGLALPLVSAPDGVLLVPGLSETGSVSLRLAPSVVSGDP